jgi:hypothetical protein
VSVSLFGTYTLGWRDNSRKSTVVQTQADLDNFNAQLDNYAALDAVDPSRPILLYFRFPPGVIDSTLRTVRQRGFR